MGQIQYIKQLNPKIMGTDNSLVHRLCNWGTNQFIERLQTEYLWSQFLRPKQQINVRRLLEKLKKRLGKTSLRVVVYLNDDQQARREVRKGAIYEQRDGKASLFYGKISEGGKTGKGLLLDQMFTAYLGDFRDDKKHGQGSIYNCRFVELVRNGVWYEEKLEKAVIVTADENKIKYNQGLYTVRYGAGGVYHGQGHFKDGFFIRKGTGTFELREDKFKYEGNWENNLPEGHGKTECVKDGKTSTYQGMFKGGMRSGNGVYTKDTESYAGFWENNKFMYSCNDKQHSNRESVLDNSHKHDFM